VGLFPAYINRQPWSREATCSTIFTAATQGGGGRLAAHAATTPQLEEEEELQRGRMPPLVLARPARLGRKNVGGAREQAGEFGGGPGGKSAAQPGGTTTCSLAPDAVLPLPSVIPLPDHVQTAASGLPSALPHLCRRHRQSLHLAADPGEEAALADRAAPHGSRGLVPPGGP
jgi:hypothetical protein